MKQVSCPTCKKPVEWVVTQTFRPFCSERCRMIDLGQWADDKYAVPCEEEPLTSEQQQRDL